MPEGGIITETVFNQTVMRMYTDHRGMVDLAPLELLGRHSLARLLQWALLRLNASQPLLSFMLPLLPVGIARLDLHARRGGEPIAGCQQNDLAVPHLQGFLADSLRDGQADHVPSILRQGHGGLLALG